MSKLTNFKRAGIVGAAVLAFGLRHPLQTQAQPAEGPQRPAAPKRVLAPGTALITFSGLYGEGSTLTQQLIPQSYQPLLRPFTDPEHPDGANIGVTIFWSEGLGSNPRVNSTVLDHTGDGDVTGDNPGSAVMFRNHLFSMSFDRPVEIPSFYWSFYMKSAVGWGGTISVYKNVADTTPLKSITVEYKNPTGFIWQEAGFPGLEITKITFAPREDTPFDIDDITVRAVGGNKPTR